MDVMLRMKRAIDYVEDNLEQKIDMDEVAKKACSSSYNFQRMFAFIADITLAEYIRRRRLTLAAFDLQNSDYNIQDIALKYGYESGTSFSRAFQTMHGIAPSKARKFGVLLKAHPRISFQISIKGEKEMDYRIEEKDSFEVFGVEALISTVDDSNYLTHPSQFWKKCGSDGQYDAIAEVASKVPESIIKDMCKVHAVMNYRKTDKNTFPYMLCGFTNDDTNIEGFDKVQIPSQTYVIFPTRKGLGWDEIPQECGKIIKQFYSEWLPTSDYEKADGPEFEFYGGNEQEAYVEIWMPVIGK